MASQSGTDATVKVAESVTVLNMASWSFTDERDALTAAVFGDTFTKVLGMGSRTVAGTISGYLDIADTTGQDVLITAYEAGTTVSGFRLFIDDTTYYTSDGAGDTDGVYIGSYNVSAAQNEIIPVEFNFSVGGSWTEA